MGSSYPHGEIYFECQFLNYYYNIFYKIYWYNRQNYFTENVWAIDTFGCLEVFSTFTNNTLHSIVSAFRPKIYKLVYKEDL